MPRGTGHTLRRQLMHLTDDWPWYQRVEPFAIRVTTCPRCEAEPGQYCVSQTGHKARYTHSGRVDWLRQLTSDAWAEGYEEGKDWQARWGHKTG